MNDKLKVTKKKKTNKLIQEESKVKSKIKKNSSNLRSETAKNEKTQKIDENYSSPKTLGHTKVS